MHHRVQPRVDQGFAGLKRTLDELDRAKISHVGTARSKSEAQRPMIFTTRQGVKIAIVAATFSLNGLPMPQGKPWAVQRTSAKNLIDQAQRARAAGADIVIAAVHLGTEYSTRENAQQVTLARALTASPDVDLVYHAPLARGAALDQGEQEVGALRGREHSRPARHQRAAGPRRSDRALHLHPHWGRALHGEQGGIHSHPCYPLSGRPAGAAVSDLDGAEDRRGIIPRPAAGCAAAYQCCCDAQGSAGIDKGIAPEACAIQCSGIARAAVLRRSEQTRFSSATDDEVGGPRGAMREPRQYSARVITRMSELFVRTLREDPADAEVPSHRWLVRAGYIRRAAPGIYTWLPLGYRVLRNVERIVREEMDAMGAQEVHFPALLPKEPYEASGRWTEYGESMFRLHDRKGAEYLLGPTHEEMFTLLVKDLYSSYKDLPLSLYQIQTKYRDEARPRAGLLRGREFVMKDSYSFDIDDEGLAKSYAAHRDAYIRIFDRLGFEYVIVHAMSGAMGGSASEEFLAIAENGEDTFVRSPGGYAANVEAARTTPPPRRCRTTMRLLLT